MNTLSGLYPSITYLMVGRKPKLRIVRESWNNGKCLNFPQNTEWWWLSTVFLSVCLNCIFFRMETTHWPLFWQFSACFVVPAAYFAPVLDSVTGMMMAWRLVWSWKLWSASEWYSRQLWPKTSRWSGYLMFCSEWCLISTLTNRTSTNRSLTSRCWATHIHSPSHSGPPHSHLPLVSAVLSLLYLNVWSLGSLSLVYTIAEPYPTSHSFSRPSFQISLCYFPIHFANQFAWRFLHSL